MSIKVDVWHKIDQAGNAITPVGNRMVSYPNLGDMFSKIEEVITWMPEGERRVLISNPFGLRKIPSGKVMDLTAYWHCMQHPDSRKYVQKFIREWFRLNQEYGVQWFFYFGGVFDWEGDGPKQRTRMMQSIAPFMNRVKLGFDAMSSNRRPEFGKEFIRWISVKSEDIYMEALAKLTDAHLWPYINGCSTTDWYNNPNRHGDTKMDVDDFIKQNRGLLLMAHQDLAKEKLEKRMKMIHNYLKRHISMAFNVNWAINNGTSYDELMEGIR